jgi:NOL1/NOP2/fmu family ribosome biogenesis protein
LAEEDERKRVLAYLEQRFGISKALFEGFFIFCRKKSWWLLAKTPHIAGASQLKTVMNGLRAFQRVGRFLKPTTRFVQIFGVHASKSVVRIDRIQLDALKNGETIPGDPGLENGYVIFSFQEQILGLGLQVDGKIHSQIPRKDIPHLNT